MKAFQRDIQIKDDLPFNDNKFVVPAALISPFMTLLHKFNPRQIGMKALEENFWRPKIHREIYHHGKTAFNALNLVRNQTFLWERSLKRN